MTARGSKLMAIDSHVGEVTIILSKLSRNSGHKQTKLIVTNLPQDVDARTILSVYQRRWIVEMLFRDADSILKCDT